MDDIFDGIENDPFLVECREILAKQKARDPEENALTVTKFLRLVNDELSFNVCNEEVKGEVASYKESHGKWVFFDLKDSKSSVNCFLPIWDLHVPLEDGMRVVVKGTPKVTPWGKFSLTVSKIMPVGEGSIKKAFELLKLKLANEGLFDPRKKRDVPKNLSKIGVISSTQAAGYADFCKILNARWGGLSVQVAHTQVQGMVAADQIISALKYFNEHSEVQIIAIIRGGGSADDLAVFNDEALVRVIASSKIPVITGIGHEVDESLSDLAADIRASTPSNVAEMLTPVSKMVEKSHIDQEMEVVYKIIMDEISSGRMRSDAELMANVGYMIMDQIETHSSDALELSRVYEQIIFKIDEAISQIKFRQKTLSGLDPEKVLKQGYAIMSGKVAVGETIKLLTCQQKIEAIVNKISKRKE